MNTLPADTRVAGFTDWAGIRRTLGFGAITNAADRATLVNNSFTRDFSARSIMEAFTEGMHGSFGWSVADLRWEMYGQATKGAILTAGLDDNLASSTVLTGLRSLGYTEADGIWTAGSDTLNAPSTPLPATFTFAAYYPRDKVILFSDNAKYLSSVVSLYRQHGRTLASVPAARQAAATLAGSLSAVITVRADSCKATGVGDETPDVQAQAHNIVKPLGTLVSYRYAGRAIFDTGHQAHLTFSMAFDSAAVATRQMALRSRLTTGPFLGRAGQLEDVITLRSTHTDGATGSMVFSFDPNRASFMEGNGTLLFAACSS